MLVFGPHAYICNPYPLQRHGLYNRFIYNYISVNTAVHQLGLLNLLSIFACERQLQMVLRLNDYFMKVLYICNTRSLLLQLLASVLSSHVRY